MRAADHFVAELLATGIGSPVSIDSSTADAPSVTTPSTGIRSPGFTITRSSTSTASTATSVWSSRAHHMRGLGLQRGEAADRLGGAALGARLEQAAEQNERDDRGDGLVVDVRRQPGAG